MPEGYVVVQVKVEDAEKFKEYQKLVPATIASHGGRYLVRGGRTERREGEEDGYERIVVLCFPSFEKARDWYDSEDYAGPLALRLAAAKARLFLVEGLD